MSGLKRKFGRWGEDLAGKFLEDKGYVILERNFQKRGGEIDLIARKDGTIHFIEVKTRKTASILRFGLPQEAVNSAKQKKIIRTALLYIGEKNDMGNINWQFDVISIVCADNGPAEICLIENAFEPDAATPAFD